MRRFALFLALSSLLVADEVQPGRPAGKPEGLRPGLSQRDVLAQLGPPARVSRQILAHRCIEQWHYPAPRSLRLLFDCPRGQHPTLVRIRTTPAAP